MAACSRISVRADHALIRATSRPTLPPMQKKSLFEQNPHLKGNQSYEQALRVNVLSSTAIEGVRKVAEKALPVSGKQAKA